MFRLWVKTESAAEALEREGIDPLYAWADDPGLTRIQRARLRAVGRTETWRRYLENRDKRKGPSGHGMDRETQRQK